MLFILTFFYCIIDVGLCFFLSVDVQGGSKPHWSNAALVWVELELHS